MSQTTATRLNPSAIALAHLPIFNVEDYGAKGDGVTNDAPAIQAAIDALTAAFNSGGPGGIVMFPRPVVYFIGTTPLSTTNNYYAQIRLPYMRSTGVRKMVLSIMGPGPACLTIGNSMTSFPRGNTAIIRSTLKGQSFSSTNGWPSVIGFPASEALGMGVTASTFTSNHSAVNLYWSGVVIQCEPQPSLIALDCGSASSAVLDDFCAWVDDAGNYPPANPTGLAFRPARVLNNAQCMHNRVVAWGFYGGIGIDEHQTINYAVVCYTKVAFPILNPFYHSVSCIQTSVEANHHIVGGLHPINGAQSVPGLAGIYPTINFLMNDIEDAANGYYPNHQPLAHVLDSANKLRGRMRYSRSMSGGLQANGLTVQGGQNLLIDDINDSYGFVRGDGTLIYALYGAPAPTPAPTPTPSPDTYIPLVFDTVLNITSNNGVWSAVTMDGLTGHKGLASSYLGPGNAGGIRQLITANSYVAILGFSATAALTGNANMKVCFYISDNNMLVFQEPGVTITSVTAIYGNQYEIHRTGAGVLTTRTKAPADTAWTTIHTYAYASTAVMYPVCDLLGTAGKVMTTPESTGLSTGSAGGGGGVQANSFIYDAFARADGPLTAPWVFFGATASIRSQAMYIAGVSGNPLRAVVQTDPNPSIHADWSLVVNLLPPAYGASVDNFLIFQFADFNNFCFVEIDGDTSANSVTLLQLQFYKFVGGVISQLAPDYHGVSRNGHKLQVKKAGTTYTVLLDDVAAQTFTGTTGLEANTKFGLGAGGDNGQMGFQNFSVA